MRPVAIFDVAYRARRARLFVRLPLVGVLLCTVVLIASGCAAPGSATPTPAQAVPTLTTGANSMTPEPSKAPSDFAVAYHWRAGTMPPPYHYEYDVEIGKGTEGNVIYRPDYPGDKTPVWRETFTLTPGEMGALYTFIKDEGIMRQWASSDPPVGGSVEWATITAGGKSYGIPQEPKGAGTAAVDKFYTYLKEKVVPRAIWDKLEAQRQEYETNYGK